MANLAPCYFIQDRRATAQADEKKAILNSFWSHAWLPGTPPAAYAGVCGPPRAAPGGGGCTGASSGEKLRLTLLTQWRSSVGVG